MNSTTFKLFANCIPVKGYYESIIFDLQRSKMLTIPNLLFEILEESKRHPSIHSLKEFYQNEYDEGIDAYFNFLIENEFAFYSDEPDNFPPIKLEFSSPFNIISASVEIENEFNYNYFDVVDQINNMGCPIIDFRFTNKVINLVKILDNINNFLNTSRYKMVNMYIPSSVYQKEFSKYLLHKHSCINKIIVFGSKIEGEDDERFDNKTIHGSLIFTKKQIDSNTQDVIDKEHFIVNIDFFIEAQAHNVALNRKVSIDKNGNIQNYLSHEKIFSNVNQDKIIDILNSEDFQRIWTINNNMIEKCKDCQYRYVCLDNSELLFKDEKIYKKEQCNFNPYTNTWVK